MDIKIIYDGEFPSLCSGRLNVIISGEGWIVEWVFPDYCLSSGGFAVWGEDGGDIVTSGSWTITDFPKGFPTDLKQAVEDAVNESVPYGCCGGCL
jgi:hypothetical protein